MKKYDLISARRELCELQRKLSAFNHAMAVIYYDGATAAPSGTASNRGVTLSVLSEETYRLSTSDETVCLLEFLDSRKEELGEKEKRQVFLLLREIRQTAKIPVDEYVAFEKLTVEAEDVWRRAKRDSDFESFRPFLEKIFMTEKRFAGYIEPDSDPYDFRLGQFEEGLNRKTLDRFFTELRSEIVPLIGKVTAADQIDDSVRYGRFDSGRQEELAHYLMKTIGLDPAHVSLSTTEHPFTTSLGSHFDVRITTHYHEDDLLSSFYSVVHEGGHALYDTGSADDLAYTVLDGGVSMSIHESQSRFYENIIGRSSAFCELVFPKLAELFPEEMKGKSPEDLFLAANKSEPSLIRTEADELTYCLHIMVRYELEKRIFDGDLRVGDLPGEWNRLYREYLGIDVPDDRRGVLQDMHWASGLIGYFPSYALGSAYGAQFLAKMKETVDVDSCVRAGDFARINRWNLENIWKHGGVYTPSELLCRVLGGPFDPKYYTDYLKKKFSGIYRL